MSFSDRPTVSPHKLIGCIGYVIAFGPVLIFSAMTALLGRCTSDGCMPFASYFLIFPGLALAVPVGGYFVARWAVKDQA